MFLMGLLSSTQSSKPKKLPAETMAGSNSRRFTLFTPLIIERGAKTVNALLNTLFYSAYRSLAVTDRSPRRRAD